MAAIIWANGAGGILLPILLGVVHGAVCLISVVQASGTTRTLRAYAKGELGTDRFLERMDPCARAAIRFRAAVICLALAGLTCIAVSAFPGRTAVAPLAAALLAVILLRTFDLVAQPRRGWFLDPLIPDSVILDMTASADPWTRFHVGWTMSGRVAMLRQAAASWPDLAPEIHQILLAQYSPEAIFVPLELAPKSVGSELRLMLMGWRVGGAAMITAALLAVMAVTLLPRDLLLMPALNDLGLPDLQTRPDQTAKEPDSPSSGPDHAGDGTNAEPRGNHGSPSDAQPSDGAENGASPGSPAGGGEAPSGEGSRGSAGGSSGGAAQEGQADQAGAEPGEDARQEDRAGAEPGEDARQSGGDRVSDASSNSNDEQPTGRAEAPDPNSSTDEASSAEDGPGDGGPGPEGRASPDGDQQGKAGEDSGADSSQQGQGGGEQASNALEGSSQGDPGVGGDGPGQELGGSDDPDGRGDGTAEEGDGQMMRAPADPDEAGGPSSGSSGPTERSSEGALAGITESTGEPPEGGEIIQTEVTASEADPVRVGPLLDGDIDGTPAQELPLREAAQPPQTDVALELTVGVPAALFAEEGEVPDAVEARLLPDARTIPPSRETPGAARQILPAWVEEMMR